MSLGEEEDAPSTLGPIVDPSAINDQRIIDSTKTEPGPKGSVVLTIKLPSGRTLKSSPIGPAEVKKVTLSWLNNVREQIKADNAAVEAEIARRRAERKGAQASEPVAGTPTDDAPASKPSSLRFEGQEVEVTDPDDFLRRQWARAKGLLKTHQERQAREEQMVDKHTKDVAKWVAMAEAAGISLDEEESGEPDRVLGQPERRGNRRDGDADGGRPAEPEPAESEVSPRHPGDAGAGEAAAGTAAPEGDGTDDEPGRD